MKKSITPLLFGILFILAGLGYLGSVLFNWDINIMFDGWWTLFIIVPTFVSILANGPRTFNVCGFLVGIVLLISRQFPHLLNARYVGVAIVSIGIIAIGVSLIESFFRKSTQPNNFNYQQNNWQAPPPQGGATPPSAEENAGNSNGDYGYNYNAPHSKMGKWDCDENPFPNCNAIFSAIDTKNISTDLQGARVSAVFGGVDLDLRDAIVTHDITIYVTAIFGGVDIFAPRNVKISLNKTDILGSTECHAYTMPQSANAPTVTFVCTALFGGIDIK